MAWFKQTEQKSPAAPQSQAPAPPASSAPTALVERQAAPVAPPAQPQVPLAEAAGASSASRVSRGLVLRGEITGREDLAIDGEMEGTLRLEGARVTIGAAGRVRASVFAREIVIHGEVRGDLRAQERIEIGHTGSVQGTAAAKRIAIEDGAIFNGSIEVLRAGEALRGGESTAATRADARPALRSAVPAPAASSAPAAGVAETAWRDRPVTASDSRS